MKLRYSLLTLAVAMGLTFGLSACTEEDTPVNPGTDVGVATDVMVNTMDANSITAKWTRAADDTGNDTLWVTEVGTTTEMYAVAFAGTSTATVSGLSSGKLYNVQVGNSTGNRTTAIEWATAMRSGKIKLWETSGTGAGQPSGLIIGPSTHGAVAAALSVTHADKALIDMVLATDPKVPTSNISLQSPEVVGSQLPDNDTTTFSDTVFYVSGGLDNDYYSSGFASRIANKAWYDQFAMAPNNMSAICLIHTESDYYARVEIVPQADGKLWNVDGSNNRSIDVIVSYQPIKNTAYASRPVGKRVSVQKAKTVGGGSIGLVKTVR